MADTVEYVVVVHGIGEQRRNATLVQTISRFAEAARGQEARSPHNSVTLGQTGTGERWIEFEGIPARGSPNGTFHPKRATSGDNLRFLDLHWSDITQEAVTASAEEPGTWVGSVFRRNSDHLRRLQKQEGQAQRSTRELAPLWLIHLTRLIRALLLIVKPVIRLLRKDFAAKLFDGYLADVQVYAECPEVRTRCVERVHARLQQLIEDHWEEEDERPPEERRKPGITMVAHSLGTVLAMDALLLAHLGTLAAGGAATPASVRFEEALERCFPGCRALIDTIAARTKRACWVQYVESLVTMGSPLEKFIGLWPDNFEYHLEGADFVVPTHEQRRGSKIVHANYVEVMDLVADPLCRTRSSKLYEAVFEPAVVTTGEDGAQPVPEPDVVYANDMRPLIAHSAYWNDPRLFTRILHGAVRGKARVKTSLDAKAGVTGARDVMFQWVPLLMGTLFACVPILLLSSDSVYSTALTAAGTWLLGIACVIALSTMAWWYSIALDRMPLPESSAQERIVRWIPLVVTTAAAGLALWLAFEGLPLLEGLAVVVISAAAVPLVWMRTLDPHRSAVAFGMQGSLLFLSSATFVYLCAVMEVNPILVSFALAVFAAGTALAAVLTARRRHTTLVLVCYVAAAYILLAFTRQQLSPTAATATTGAASAAAWADQLVGGVLPLVTAGVSGFALWALGRASQVTRVIHDLIKPHPRLVLVTWAHAAVTWLVAIVAVTAVLYLVSTPASEGVTTSLQDATVKADNALQSLGFGIRHLAILVFSFSTATYLLFTVVDYRGRMASRDQDWNEWAEGTLADYVLADAPEDTGLADTSEQGPAGKSPPTV